MGRSIVHPILPLAILAIASAGRADDETPEAVLARKGLVREGVTLLLADSADRAQRFRTIEAESRLVRIQLEPLRDEKLRLDREIDKARKEARRAKDEKQKRDKNGDTVKQYTGEKADAEGRVYAAEQARRAFDQQYGPERKRLEGELSGLAQQAEGLRHETLVLYRAHAADPEVKAAVRALNRTLRPRLVLGPVSGAAEYQALLRDDSLALLRERGVLHQAERQRLVLAAEREVGLRHLEAQARGRKLAAAEAKGTAGARTKGDDLIERRRAVAAEGERAVGERKQQLAALLAVLDGQIGRLPVGSTEPGSAARAAAGRIATARGEFVQAVRELRRAADAVPEARRAAEADADVAMELAELNEGRGKGKPPMRIVPLVEYRQALEYLARVEPTLAGEASPPARRAAGRESVPSPAGGSGPARP